MPGSDIISAVSTELRQQVLDALRTTPEQDFQLEGELKSLVTSKPPGDDKLPNTVVASLYLFQVAVSEHLRNQRAVPDRDDDRLLHRPPTPIRLRYLFTPLHEDESIGELILGRTVQHFQDAPSFATVGGQPLDDSHGAGPRALRVHPETLTLEQYTQLWTALSTPLRTSMMFRVEIVAIDSAQPPATVPRSTQLVGAVGAKAGPS